MQLQKSQPLNWHYFTTLKSLLNFIKRPTNTEVVYDVEDALMRSHPHAMAAAVRHMLSEPSVVAIVQERYVAPTPNLSLLLSYPPTSLGYQFAQHMTKFGLDPGFYRKVHIVDDATYLVFRTRQTHDIWHVVTGFDIDVAGEVGIKAFELAQTRRPLAGIMIAGAFLKVLLNQPQDLEKLVDSIAIGYRMGRKAKPLLAQKWEEHWEQSLEDWRSQLNLEPMPVYIP